MLFRSLATGIVNISGVSHDTNQSCAPNDFPTLSSSETPRRFFTISSSVHRSPASMVGLSLPLTRPLFSFARNCVAYRCVQWPFYFPRCQEMCYPLCWPGEGKYPPGPTRYRSGNLFRPVKLGWTCRHHHNYLPRRDFGPPPPSLSCAPIL